MKLRSALLIACLIVVPLLAMFSHKVPTATRSAIRERLWDPMIRPLASALGLSAPPPTSPPPRQATASLPTADPSQPLQPSQALGLGEPDVAIAGKAPPPAILLGSEDSLPIGGATGRESLEARLRALGATRIDWTPGQGGDGLHRCSCRIPAEPSGQLHRIFQAAATDPVAALDNLVGQVTAWSMRSGGTAASPAMPLRR
jgi:hypothetical protein